MATAERRGRRFLPLDRLRQRRQKRTQGIFNPPVLKIAPCRPGITRQPRPERAEPLLLLEIPRPRPWPLTPRHSASRRLQGSKPPPPGIGRDRLALVVIEAAILGPLASEPAGEGLARPEFRRAPMQMNPAPVPR